MNVLRTGIALLNVILIVFYNLIFAVLFGILSLFGQKLLSAKLLYKPIQISARSIFSISQIKIICKGSENIPKKTVDGGICFASNHTGIYDIPLVYATTGVQVGFMAKKELIFLPFINMWILALGGVFIDRKNPRKAILSVKKCTEKIRKGFSSIVFPEGTRSRGRGLLPYKSGSFKMAVDADALIIPVAITGCDDVFENHGYINSTTVYITYGKPIDTKNISGEQKRHTICEMSYNATAQMLAEHGTKDAP
jgi:1-acyl-sn-glycerol-3-phosphate acyltransferase